MASEPKRRRQSTDELQNHREELKRQQDQPNANRERAEPLGYSTADIAVRAYELFEQRGGEHGHDCDDWFQAERELRQARAA